ncbi:hypothetical protein HMPREF9445_01983 [Bacteroides clarus YIT 12056]|uniref:Uncharacterized protein n=1 Tax=Bacteroides clarus YIT 12056 TaxID=762984 RepID=A0ABN0CNG4_9BACE|nr:hypothetical protein HMPREF9445_01983 [Bacteroides clarus YIT 12056]
MLLQFVSYLLLSVNNLRQKYRYGVTSVLRDFEEPVTIILQLSCKSDMPVPRLYVLLLFDYISGLFTGNQ